MVSRFRQSPQLQLLCIALSLLCASTVFGLSAFLAAFTDPLSTSLTIRRGNEFGISIASYNTPEQADLYPGGITDFDPYLINEGDYDVYAFIQVDIADPDLSLLGITQDWTLLPTDDPLLPVYAYGSSSTLTPLKAKDPDGPMTTPTMCTGLCLDGHSDLQPQNLSVSAVGFAIQTDGLDTTDPVKVWEQLNSQLVTDQDARNQESEEA